MVQHANKILAATELRAKITRELVPGPTLQVNNYLLHDAAQIVTFCTSTRRPPKQSCSGTRSAAIRA